MNKNEKVNNKYVLINCNIIDVNNSVILKDKNIFINKDIIEKITDINSDTNGYEVIDLSNRYVMPGLINLHVHLFGTGKPSKILGGGGLQKLVLKFISTKLGNKVADSLVKNHALMQLATGVTTIRSVGDFCYSDVRVRDKINNNEFLGPRLIVSGPAITTSDGHGAGTFAITSGTIEGLKELVRKNYEHKVDFIKTCTTGGVMDAKKLGEPGVVKMSIEQTKAVCDEAHRLGLKVASHVESSEGVLIALKGGVDTIEHGSELTDETVKLFKDENKAFVSTISPALPLAKLDYRITKLTSFSQFNSNVVFENMIKCAKRVIKEDIIMGMGTDASCPLVTQYNTWKELLYTTKIVGTSNGFALKTATINNAKILGLDNKIGSIEENKIADILVVNDNPLENISTLSNPCMVIARGNILPNLKVKKNEQIEKMLSSIM